MATIEGEGQTLSIDRRVVDMLMQRDGLDEDAALDQAMVTARLVAARRAELATRDQPPEHPDDLDPARRNQLERAALVRVWLDDVFEPEHQADDIPRAIVAQNMADPALSRRLFHPELYVVCQALLVPAALDENNRNVQPPSDPEAAQRWRAAAEAAFAPFVARVRQLEPDLLATEDCSLLGRQVGASERTFELTENLGPVTMRFERFGFAPSLVDDFDAEWVATVTAVRERSIIGPFPTRFGLHLVVIGSIEPAQLADGSLPADELARAREAALRDEIQPQWQTDQLRQILAEQRDRRIVRLAPELELERER